MKKMGLFILYSLGLAFLCYLGAEGGFWPVLFVVMLAFGGYWIFKKLKQPSDRKIEENFYQQVSVEIHEKNFKPEIVTKAAAESNGNKDQAQSLYIKFRVEQLMRDFKEQKFQSDKAFWFQKVGVIFISIITVVIVRQVLAPSFKHQSTSLQVQDDLNQSRTLTDIEIKKYDDQLEAENAKQIQVINSSVTPPTIQNKYDVLSNNTYTVEVTLRNNSFNVVERVDLLVKWYTKDGYFENQEEINDFTEGKLLTPKSMDAFKETISLQKHEQEDKFQIFVQRAKFRDYFYRIYKADLSHDKNSKLTTEVEEFYRFDNFQNCQNELDNSKKGASCIEVNERIRAMLNYQPVKQPYCVAYLQMPQQNIQSFIQTLPGITESESEAYTSGIKERFAKTTGAKLKVVCVTSNGIKKQYFDNFDSNSLGLTWTAERIQKELLTDSSFILASQWLVDSSNKQDKTIPYKGNPTDKWTPERIQKELLSDPVFVSEAQKLINPSLKK